MRIMIDGWNLALEQGTGVATYGRNLANCVRREGHELHALFGKSAPDRGDPILREAMFVDVGLEKRPLHETARAVARNLPRTLRVARPLEVPETGHVIRLERRHTLPDCDRLLNGEDLFRIAQMRFLMFGRLLEVALPEPVDIAHWTYPIPLRARGALNVYTFHDLVPLKLPYATLDRKKHYHRLVTTLASTADHVVTVSETSRDDILGMLPVPPEKVTNTYQSVAIPEALLEKSDADIDIELANAFHAPVGEAAQGAPIETGGLRRDGFYLFVGAIEPKKNLRRIIEAYLASGAPEPLVVVGRKAWRYKDVVTMMTRSPRIIYLDYLPFAQVITLMRAARAVLFASLYEGFGLPVLEAFICGTPVVTSRVGATGEIAGDAALLVDPYDTREIRDAIRALSAPDSDALRARLREAGRRRAAEFDEAHVARRIDALYRRLLTPLATGAPGPPPVRYRRTLTDSPSVALDKM